jgi:glutamyl/glutaminyl-tRNA synthetase
LTARESSIKSRLAPTPSGFLHKGNAFNFLLTWLHVRLNDGKLRLRIDDMDVQRAKAIYIQDIFSTLDWLGIDWDEGPFSVADQQKFSQSLRMDRYREMLSALEQGGYLFACNCSRYQIQTASSDGGYPGTCLNKNLSSELPGICLRCKSDGLNKIALRDLSGNLSWLDMPVDMKYSVLQRKDGFPAYQICSLADDIDHQINFIIRGSDLLGSSIFQLGLASLLGSEDFSLTRFYHHPLLTDEQGRKLSKTTGSMSLQHLRTQKGSLEQLFAEFSKWIGLPERASNARELLSVSKSVADATTRLVPT